MELKTLEQISSERKITKRLLIKWHADGLKCVRTTYLMTTDEWLDEYINYLAEKPKKQKVIQLKEIKRKPLQKIEGLKVH